MDVLIFIYSTYKLIFISQNEKMFLNISLIASLEEESINGSKLLHFHTKKI